MSTETGSLPMTDDINDHPGPPLPERRTEFESSSSPPPPYSESELPLLSLPSSDPRSSSTQSLTPEPTSSKDGRRKLLLVYIHGFMGAENSFRSFPAHVHNLLAITMSESHVVHSKIYPRYQSRRPIQFVTEDFSKWLAPHESPITDTILLGHSMGGLLAAEAVLLPPYSSTARQALRHCILGTINFDVPFLGMHPGVIKSGLGSIFNPAPPPKDQPTSLQSPDMSPQQSPTYASSSTLSLDALSPATSDPLGSPEPTDPNFNPTFENDVLRPVRKGWENMFHFARKHRDDFLLATKQLVTSHLEFGGAMADFRALQSRYARIRTLEEEDEKKRDKAASSANTPPRVRFVNYYTASTGRPKNPKVPLGESQEERVMSPEPAVNVNLSASPSRSTSQSPRISIEKADGTVGTHEVNESLASSNDVSGPASSPTEDGKHDDLNQADMETTSILEGSSSFPYLPEIPPMPEEPKPLNLPPDLDKDTRKYAEQGHAAAIKAHRNAIKARSKIIKEREKIETKHTKQIRKRQEAQDKASRKEQEERLRQAKANAEAEARFSQDSNTETTIEASVLTPSPSTISLPSREQSSVGGNVPSSPVSSKPHRDRKFCILPSKMSSGKRDPAWVRVPMEGVDEVGAHCGLFFLGETYERLVGDVAARVEEWWREAEGERVARELGDE